MRQILLITLGLSTALFASFSKNGNIVTDSDTRLQWQDDAMDTRMSWSKAIDYCESLNLDSRNDWRLPNIKELISIMDDTKTNPSIDTAVFSHTLPNVYWSSTTYYFKYGGSGTAWYVNFKYGSMHKRHSKSADMYVRCVRAGQP